MEWILAGMYGSDSWALRKAEQNLLERTEIEETPLVIDRSFADTATQHITN